MTRNAEARRHPGPRRGPSTSAEVWVGWGPAHANDQRRLFSNGGNTVVGSPLVQVRPPRNSFVATLAANVAGCEGTSPSANAAAPATGATPGLSALERFARDGVNLARSKTVGLARFGIPTVIVSRSEISIEGGSLRVPLSADRSAGVDAKYKTSSSDLYISSLADALGAAKPSSDAFAFAFDASTPYRVVVEVLFTAGQVGVMQYHLLMDREGVVGALQTFPPRMDEYPPGEQPLSFTVILKPGGAVLKMRDNVVVPGCTALGRGVSVPKRRGAYDLEQLRWCAMHLRDTHPESRRDRSFTLSAAPEIPFGALVAVIDHVRTRDDGRPLFPNVSFGLER